MCAKSRVPWVERMRAQYCTEGAEYKDLSRRGRSACMIPAAKPSLNGIGSLKCFEYETIDDRW